EEIDLDELIKIAKSLNILPLLDKMTWSCYFPENGNSCGTKESIDSIPKA
ncbi:unnamed protein product, partial [marine sediment metagenome]